MILKLYRKSRLPLLLEEEEAHTMTTLEIQGRWIELEDFEKELRQNDDIKELIIEADNLGELKLLLEAMDNKSSFTIDFKRNVVVINDQGEDH